MANKSSQLRQQKISKAPKNEIRTILSLGEIIENEKGIKFLQRSNRRQITESSDYAFLLRYPFFRGDLIQLSYNESPLFLIYKTGNNSELVLALRIGDTIITTFKSAPINFEISGRYDPIIIRRENFFYFVIYGLVFRITENEIVQLKAQCISSTGERIPFRPIYSEFNRFQTQKYQTILNTINFEGQQYVSINPYLYRIEKSDDEFNLHLVDENLERFQIFNSTSILLPGKGILTMGVNELTLYNPISHELFIDNVVKLAEIEAHSDQFILMPYCISLTKDNNIAIITKKIILENHHEVANEYTVETKPISDLDFTRSDYTYTKPLLSIACKQYTPHSKDGFKETQIQANGYKFQAYSPVSPFKNYRIIKGFGEIPSVLKAPNFVQLTEAEILTQIGAPIFYYKTWGDDINN
ncbi:hypothetical protein GPJ56_008000 [Histomonas meleagridis]|uniref:uncharacterized protein n=1 Tax=Histomonas meleagridis TaxID=135588 RepID=UPI00355A38D7|nr:hypothetical protein GPJ56_008000 [Histomonas meleagridis]KAH0803942.1 hypothetical protein GO595_002772 [Histomonas meleagridis]